MNLKLHFLAAVSDFSSDSELFTIPLFKFVFNVY